MKSEKFKFHTTFFLILISISLHGCLSKITIGMPKSNKKSSLEVTINNVKVENNQIILSGSNLSNITNFKIKDGATETEYTIESNNGSTLIANSLSNITIATSKVLSLIISNANAASTYTINFSLCDATLGTKAINCSIVPNDKEVLSYDASSGKWKPRAINGLSYQGAWDASGSLPSTTTVGDYYIVSVASGAYRVGDWIVFNGSTWDKIDNSQTITSVFGRTGVVVGAEGDYNLNKLSDVDVTTITPTNGNVLKFDGTNWVPGTISAGSGTVTDVIVNLPLTVSSSTTTPTISINQANSTTNGYLTSSDWTTFNSKQGLISTGATTEYYRGDKTWQTLNTAVVSESTNKYFTEARVLATPLTGLSVATGTDVSASDSILTAIGKLQNQSTSTVSNLSTLSSSDSNKLSKNTSDSITATITVSGAGDIILPSTPAGMTSAVNKTYVEDRIANAANQWTDSSGSIYRSSGNVGIGFSTAPSYLLDVRKTNTTSSDGSQIMTRSNFTVNPTSNQLTTDKRTSFEAYTSIPSGASKNIGKVYGSVGSAENYGNGITIERLSGSQSWTLNYGNATVNKLSGHYITSEVDNGTVTNLNSIETWSGIYGGTVTNHFGLLVNLTNSGGTVSNRYGIYLDTPVGTATNDFGIYQSGTQKNYFGGDVGILGTNASYNLWVNGTAGGTSAYVNTSDARLKKNIKKIDNSLEKILNINGVSYDWRRDDYPELNLSKRRELGVIAQNIEKTFPEAVSTDSDGKKLVAYTMLIAPIINAIHDLSELIKELGNENKSQDRSLASINERLSKLESDNKALIKKNIELENELNNYKRNK